ncbi:MAG: hypothetical protein M3Y81_15115, partial [Chloroflexota bacterium]|nr:hypothetical protein [Chloroflexota bacterium]
FDPQQAACLDIGQPRQERGGKLGETRKVFKVKSTKSARIIEIDCLQIAKAAFREALPRCDLLITEAVKAAPRTLQTPGKAIIKAKSSIQALHLIIIALFAPILSVSPQKLC